MGNRLIFTERQPRFLVVKTILAGAAIYMLFVFILGV